MRQPPDHARQALNAGPTTRSRGTSPPPGIRLAAASRSRSSGPGRDRPRCASRDRQARKPRGPSRPRRAGRSPLSSERAQRPGCAQLGTRTATVARAWPRPEGLRSSTAVARWPPAPTGRRRAAAARRAPRPRTGCLRWRAGSATRAGCCARAPLGLTASSTPPRAPACPLGGPASAHAA